MRRKFKEQSTAANEAALIRNTHPDPTQAMTAPATAGPTIRAALKEVEFSATAFDRSASPTSSDTKVWRAGASNAEAQPSRNANTQTCHNCTTPATVSRPSASASAPMAAWVPISSRRRSRRSAA